MSDWQRDTGPQHAPFADAHAAPGDPGTALGPQAALPGAPTHPPAGRVRSGFPLAPGSPVDRGFPVAPGFPFDETPPHPVRTSVPDASCVTPAGADWLASACTLPLSVHALWLHRPASPSVLPCGTAFDVVSAPPLPGRLILERLWSRGPGSGPVAVHRGRLLLFAAVGTAQRLPALLGWGEWRRKGQAAAVAETFPSLLCLGAGDSVTIPAVRPGGPASGTRWLVAPDVRHPWLPGPGVLLRACLRSLGERRGPHAPASVRAGRGPGSGDEPISGTADRDARVYDVTRRR